MTSVHLNDKLSFGLLNAWLLCVPLILLSIFIAIFRKGVAKRMSNMTGYDVRQKFFTVAASLAPYPFMVLTFWTPFTPTIPQLVSGIAIYTIGVAALFITTYTFANAATNQLIVKGPYRLSRNPLYVSAALVFVGICLVTANPILFAIVIVLLLLQHFMILAEEHICQMKYGTRYVEYSKTVPRYLAFI